MTGGDGDPADRVRYRFGPLERRGLIAGWRGGQIAAVAVGLVLGVAALRDHPSVAGAVVAFLCAAGGVAVACWPVRGRTGEQWAPVVLRWVADGWRGRIQPSPLPARGTTVPRSVAIETRPGPGRPGVFDGLHIVGVPVAGSRAGVVVDHRSRSATAVLAVRGHSFALLGPAEQDARVGGWARVLAALAREGSAVHRLQWVETCLPDDGAAAHRYREAHAVLGPDTPAGASYAGLVDPAAPATRRHRLLVAVTVRTPRPGWGARPAPGSEPPGPATAVREAVALRGLLAEADATVEGILGPGALAASFRQAWTATTGGHVPDDGRRAGDDRGSGAPWPMAVRPTWEAVHTDQTWHVVYWVAEWPRIEVTPDFLGPLLFSPLRRTLSVVMEPVSPAKAARQVAQARTADRADAELRRRGGFLTTARQHQEQQHVDKRDAELADGHAQYRFSGYLSVTADGPDQLHDGCALLEQAAGQARLELRRLYGEQDAALACTLPLGRGLA